MSCDCEIHYPDSIDQSAGHSLLNEIHLAYVGRMSNLQAGTGDAKFSIQIGSDWPPNGTNLGLNNNGAPKCTETDLKKSQICPIWGPI